MIAIRQLLHQKMRGAIITLLLILILGLFLFEDYGVTIDEPIEMHSVQWNRELIFEGKEIPYDMKYYGIFFNYGAEIFAEALDKFIPWVGEDRDISEPENWKEPLNQAYRAKHLFTFLFSLIAYGTVAVLVGVLCGSDFAFFGPLVLLLFPRFMGHSFFNPKDIPFAALFTLSTLVGAYFVSENLESNGSYGLGKNKTTLLTCLVGLSIGLLSSVRIGGFILIFQLLLAQIVLTILLEKRVKGKQFLVFLSQYILLIAVWAITIIVWHPASWANPLEWFAETVSYLSKHAWKGQNLLLGYDYTNQPPWFYLPVWFFITTPLIFQIFFAIGIFLIPIYINRNFRTDRKTLPLACFILLLLQVFCLPLISIVKGSTVYNGIRQFLFVIPGIAVIAGSSLIICYQYARSFKLKSCSILIIFLIFSNIALDMIRLHPYQYIYFNRITRSSVEIDRMFDTDYWGLSMREAIDWIEQYGDSNIPVVFGGPEKSATVFSDPNIELISYKKAAGLENFYYIGYPRHGFKEQYSQCPVLHEVKRNLGATVLNLTVVKKCNL